ncbi:LysR family transcriptional regulator [Chondromyces apiculatus]|uniref:Transcriptional regulator, LysR family n=1 Tax=Chondromyces apiculatus DSM 436 TaxID=1192034 RepID=A0A017T1R0_9BACT|nr:LysR family transcriptional regulator [Chondromyces apiculatus]EYF03194.1 transcriptional regulator, LysR family [Chondromyces apiculatus DSM 436]
MDLNHLSLFTAVAETASFTEAARRLGVPKSTVSRAIATLEADLGVRLLQRTTRAVALTTAGQAFLARVGPHLRSLTAAVGNVPELDEEPSGTLRLTATADFGTAVLAEILVGFCRRYPRVTLDMALTSRTVDLVKEGFDAAFRLLLAKPRDSGLIARKLVDLNMQYYAAPEYLLARGTPKTLDELGDHDSVSLTGGRPSLPSERVLAKTHTRLLADDGFFAREAVRQGMGIGLFPSFLAQQDVLTGKLVRVLPRWTLPTGGIFLVYPSGRHLPKKMVVLREHLTDALRARFQGAPKSTPT